MPIDEHDQEFNMLSCFAHELVDTKLATAERFVKGLRNDIQGFVRAFKPAT